MVELLLYCPVISVNGKLCSLTSFSNFLLSRSNRFHGVVGECIECCAVQRPSGVAFLESHHFKSITNGYNLRASPPSLPGKMYIADQLPITYAYYSQVSRTKTLPLFTM